MNVKNKIIDTEFSNIYGDDAYSIAVYDQKRNILTVGGRAKFCDHILETIVNIFELSYESIPDGIYNQNINIRYCIPNISLKQYQKGIIKAKSNHLFHVENFSKLNRMM